MAEQLQFTSWMRQGLGTLPLQTENGHAVIHPGFVVTRQRSGTSEERRGKVALPLVGPGDIVGINTRFDTEECLICHISPTPDAMGVESNYFPLLEFSLADFPWRYTARAADDEGRWQPWLCLLAFTDAEAQLLSPGVGQPLPAIRVVDGTPLPDPTHIWAWAHHQYHQGSAKHISRLLCVRRFADNTPYTVYLVPLYRAGAQAGLGEAVNADPTLTAWTGNISSGGLRLPVYFSWRFQTGPDGDFRSLAERLIKGVFPLPPNTGLRAIDASHSPGGGLPAPAPTEPLLIAGAMSSPEPALDSWDEPNNLERNAWQQALAQVLQNPRSVIPLYGWRHRGARREVRPNAVAHDWLSELNLDPRLRVAAALGAQVIREGQHEYLKRAWAQVRGVDEINNALAQAQFARSGAEQLYTRVFQTLTARNPAHLLMMTAGIHSHIRVGDTTVFELTKNSPGGRAVFDGSLRRRLRPSSPIGRGQNRVTGGPVDLFDSLHNGSAFPSSPSVFPNDDPPRTLQAAGFYPGEDQSYQEYFGAAPWIETDIELSDTLYECPDERRDPVDSLLSCSDNYFSWIAFRDSMHVALGAVDTPPIDGRTLGTPFDVEVAATAVLDALEPGAISKADVLSKLVLSGTAFPTMSERSNGVSDPLAPVFASPIFPDPMFEPLRALSQDWILAGLDAMPLDSIALACVNWKFVEAYLVGVNDAMAKLLLWHHYPADLRGTFFRQFWNPESYRDSYGQPIPIEDRTRRYPDITHIHEWTESLGFNDNPDGLKTRSEATGGDCDTLTLVIRGDLLRRYPNTIVYALKANADGSYPTTPAWVTGVKAPVFRGDLPPDIVFYRFELSEVEVLQDGGYFFVLQEQNDEIRFGQNDKPGSSDTTAYFTPDTLIGAGDVPERAAEVATKTLRSPYLVAFHARRLLGTDTP